MSELCLDCYNKIMETNEPRKMFHMTKEFALCEECGQWKPVIIRVRTRYLIKVWFGELAENARFLRQSQK